MATPYVVPHRKAGLMPWSCPNGEEQGSTAREDAHLECITSTTIHVSASVAFLSASMLPLKVNFTKPRSLYR